jgi:galactokinase/mevalonate kinase-like predicted kinase
MLQQPWDYLIVTASNDVQAAAYDMLLDQRRRLKLLGPVRHACVIPDPDGQRVGSGSSTVYCLLEVLRQETQRRDVTPQGAQDWRELLGDLRILIVHAGGDSKRLPAYGPCGKIFLPVPGDSESALPITLFDRQLELLLALPDSDHGRGQLLVTSGDVLLQFDPRQVRFDTPGITALGCLVAPEEASRYGVYLAGADGQLERFLQKPTPKQQLELGVVDRFGQSLLDIGVMNFDADAAMALLEICQVGADAADPFAIPAPMRETIGQTGLDLYREICCAFGTRTTLDDYRTSARQAGSRWDDAALARMYETLHRVPFMVQTLARCNFLHFGTTRQLIHSGQELVQRDQDLGRAPAVLGVNLLTTKGTKSTKTEECTTKGAEGISNSQQGISNHEVGVEGTKGTEENFGFLTTKDTKSTKTEECTTKGGEGISNSQQGISNHEVGVEGTEGTEVFGRNAWVEGCRIGAAVRLGGDNVLIGVDVDRPLDLPVGGCVDVLAGVSRGDSPVWFVRCYGIDDQFKDGVAGGATFCGQLVMEWLERVGAHFEDVWPGAQGQTVERTIWDARLFPAVSEPNGWREWLWMLEPQIANDQQKAQWQQADRYSLAEMATLTDLAQFHQRREQLHSAGITDRLTRYFRPESRFSAADLVETFRQNGQRQQLVDKILKEADVCLQDAAGSPDKMGVFGYARIMHTLGAALEHAEGDDSTQRTQRAPRGGQAEDWKRAALQEIGGAIIASSAQRIEPPCCALRPDETVWGRAPARIDLGGGWTDTPPFTLERGGRVINAAINLNGQPPIHCYARVIKQPVVRLSSIDLGRHIEITRLDQLLDYRNPRDEFALAKAALAISGFSPEMCGATGNGDLKQILNAFGGGIELTTLVGIPKGSGLGTSSIVGATILAVIHRVLGRNPTPRELFHDVLRLEQALTTGGGWQDQVGGAVRGVKQTTTQPGMFPDPTIHFLPSDLLDPQLNGGTTLLYYTGLTRLAKNILERVVAGYLNRDRAIMAAMNDLYVVARDAADALSRNDPAAFGRAIDDSMRTNIALCPEVTNPEIEQLIQRIRPHIHGSRIPGAGSGGFLLLVCKSPDDAAAVRRLLDENPLNERSRFFDFDVSRDGLVVTTC